MSTRNSRKNNYDYNSRLSFVKISYFLKFNVFTSDSTYTEICYKIDDYEVKHLSDMSTHGSVNKMYSHNYGTINLQ